MGSGKPTKAHSGNGRLIANAIVLLTAIIAMGISTFAWFSTQNPGPNEVDLKSGDNAVTLDVLAYKNGYSTDADGDPVEAAYNKDNGLQLENATKVGSSSNEASYVVTFNSDTLSAFKYANSSGALYDDELSMAEKNFPHLYVELRYTKPTLDGFVKASVSNINFAADTTSYTNITESLGYQYRFVTEKNTSELPYKNGMRAAYADATYTGSSWMTLSTTGFSLYSSADTTGYSNTTSSTLSDQCYVPSFARTYDGTNYYYSKSTLLEVRINPLKWMEYFRTNTSAYENQFSFGVSFSINFDYSNQPFFTSSTAPRLVATPSEIQLGVGETATSTLTPYNFSANPDYSVTSSDENLVIAYAPTTGNTLLELIAGDSAGTGYLYVTATYGTESATTTITVTVYNGPTLIISPTGMTIDAGKSASISATYMGFTGTPTLTATSSSTALATVSVNGSSVLVTGVSAGAVTVSVTATSGAETDTKTCAVTVLAQTATLVSLEVTTKPLKLEYLVGDTLDTTGCVITATWSNNTTSEVTSSCTFSPTTIASTSDTTITVTYHSATTTFPITVSTGSVYNSTIYKLITSTSDLVAGAKYVIIGDNTGNGLAAGAAGYALSTNQKTNNRGAVSLNILAGTPTYVDVSSTVETLTLGGNADNGWTFYANRSATTGYLNPGSSTNSAILHTEAALDTYSYWTVGITSGTGVASIVNKGKDSRNVMRFYYTSTNQLFSCYDATNNQRDVYLFKQDTTVEVERIEVRTLPTKTTYTAGDAFASAGLSITVYWTNGTTSVISDGFSLSPANGDTLANVGTQTVNVTYEGKSTSFDLTVEPRVLSSIEVTTSPTTDIFYVEDSIDLTGLVVTAYYTNSSQSVVTSFCTLSTPTGTPVTSDMIGTLTDTVSYTENGVTKTTSFILTIRAAEIDHITISATAGHISTARTWFATNEPFSVKGLIIKAVFANYTETNKNVEYFSENDYGTSADKKFYTEPAIGTVLSTTPVDSYLINVYLTENPARHVSYHVAVYDPALTAPDSVSVFGGFTTTVSLTQEHFANENATLTNWGFSSNNSAVATTGMSVSGTTLSIATSVVGSDTTGTISVTGTDSVGNTKTAVINVTVKAPTISFDPTAPTINGGNSTVINVILAGWTGTPTVTRAIQSGSTYVTSSSISNVTPTGAKLNILAASTATRRTAVFRVTATLGTYSIYKDVSLVITPDTVTLDSIEVTTLPTQTTYTVGDTFDTSGMVVTAYYSDYSSATITSYSLSPTNGSTLSTVGTQTITVSYGGVSTTFTVTVNPNTTTHTITANLAGFPTSYGANDTASLDGIDMVLNNVATFNSGSTMQFKKSTSYMYNTSDNGSVTTIVIIVSTGYAPKVYCGSSSNPTGNSVTPASSVDTYTYTIPNGYHYYKIVGSTSGVSTFESIAITCAN
jgi:hypothetical protein